MIDVHSVIAEFKLRFGEEPLMFSAPGRVNLIGEHTDYNDGFVLPFAIDRRTYVACRPREDDKVRAYTITLDEEAEFNLSELENKDKDWTVYIRGMFDVLRPRGVPVKGMDLVIDTDIPFGAGLSSSAALEIAAGLAITSLAGHQISPLDLALAGQEVEHKFAGVRSGIMDQLVSASARDGNLLLIDCRSLDTEDVPFEFPQFELVVCDTRVKHELASSAYNDRRAECEKGVELLKKHLPDIKALRDVSVEQLEEFSFDLPNVVAQRCRHVVTENARTLEAAEAVGSRDHERLGRLMFESHASLRDDYEVSSPELDMLVESASGIEGVVGSRMTGGGFGGCTISLVAKEKFREFRDEIEDQYEETFGRPPAVFEVKPSPGAEGFYDQPEKLGAR